MNRPSSSHLFRSIALFMLVGGLLALSFGGATWFTAAQPLYGQTVPRATATVATAIASAVATISPTPIPTPGDGVGVIVPGNPTVISSTGRRCTIVVSPDDFSDPGRLEVDEALLDSLPARNRDLVYLRSCEIRFIDTNGTVITNYTSSNPMEICFPYTDADLARARNNPAAFTIVYFDPATNTWLELPLTLDTTNRLVCGQLSTTGIVALVIRSAQAGTLPDTSGNLPDTTATIVATPTGPVAAAAPAPAATADVAAPLPAETQQVAEQPEIVAVAGVAATPELAEATNRATSSPGAPSAMPFLVALVIVVFVAVLFVLGRRIMISDREG
jgi:hypothetical protein